MKLKQIAIAAALMASATAFAAILPGNVVDPTATTQGNSELFFVAWDPVAKVSYALDLGIQQNQFRAVADNAAAGYTQTWTFGTGGANDTTYFNQFIAATAQANWRWSVQSTDNIGTNGLNGKSLTTTVTNGVTIAGTASGSVGATGNNVLGTSLATYDTFTGISSDLGSHVPFNDFAVNGANVSVSSNPSSYFLAVANPGFNGNGQFDWTTDNAFGQSASYVYLTRSSTSNQTTALVSLRQYGNEGGFGSFTFAGGTAGSPFSLTYSLAPVPEAQTYAMMLAGLGCLVMLARRRKAD